MYIESVRASMVIEAIRNAFLMNVTYIFDIKQIYTLKYIQIYIIYVYILTNIYTYLMYLYIYPLPRQAIGENGEYVIILIENEAKRSRKSA